MFKTTPRPRNPRTLMSLALVAAMGCATPLWAQPAILHGENPLWHIPASGLAATWVGDASQAVPAIELGRQAIQRTVSQLRIQTDARTLRLTAGSRVTELEIEPDQAHLLTLDGQEDAPSIHLDRQEQFRNRGGWIGILWRSDEPHITLTFVGATYVNLSFPAAVATAAQPAAPAPTQQSAAWDAPRQAVIAPAPVAPPSPASEATAQATATPIVPAQPQAAPATRQPPPATPSSGPIVASSTGEPDLGPARQYAPAPGYYPTLIEPDDSARLNIDAGVDFLSGYFYRGMARSQGRLVVQPWVESSLRIFGGPDHHDQVLNAVNLLVGARSTHLFGDPRLKEGQDERWFELAWHGGIEMQAFDRWRFGVLYENIENVRTSWRDVHQVNAYVSFDDSDPAYDWSLQPYLLFSYEYEKQSDAGFLSKTYYDDRRFKRGVYMEMGVRPEFEVFKVSGRPAKLSLPVVVGFSLDDYFQDTQADDSWFGYADIGANLNIPIWSMPTDAGGRQLQWSLDLGVHAILPGSTVRDINKAAGAGDDDVQFIGNIGLKFNY